MAFDQDGRIRVEVTGAAGEGFFESLRRQGSFNGTTIPPNATDAEILDLIGDGFYDRINDEINGGNSAASVLPSSVSTTANDLFIEADAAGNVVARVDRSGGEILSRNPHGRATQDLLRSAGAGRSYLQAGYVPNGQALAGNARYVWSGLPRDLRSDPAATAIASYVFQWPPDPVPASQVRRARGNTNSSTWALDAVTVANGPCTDYFRVHQFRDLSAMRDRVTGTTWIAVNSIQRAVSGYTGTHFALAKTTNGTDITLVGYVEIPIPTMQVWSPEWFADNNGELYIIVSVNKAPQIYTNGDFLDSKWGYHLLRCIDLETAQFDYLGEMTGAAWPKMQGGANPGETSVIDPALVRLNGVYVSIWKAETAKNVSGFTATSANGTNATVPYGTLGWAASPDIMGPYNNGRAFYRPNGDPIRGEGQHVIQLPSGGYRLIFDDFLNLYGGGFKYADTADFINFPNDVQDMPVSNTYNRHSTFVVGLVA